MRDEFSYHSRWFSIDTQGKLISTFCGHFYTYRVLYGILALVLLAIKLGG